MLAMEVCDLCERPYEEHASNALTTENEHGWRWNDAACPTGSTPFHPTQVFTKAYCETGFLGRCPICCPMCPSPKVTPKR